MRPNIVRARHESASGVQKTSSSSSIVISHLIAVRCSRGGGSSDRHHHHHRSSSSILRSHLPPSVFYTLPSFAIPPLRQHGGGWFCCLQRCRCCRARRLSCCRNRWHAFQTTSAVAGHIRSPCSHPPCSDVVARRGFMRGRTPLLLVLQGRRTRARGRGRG